MRLHKNLVLLASPLRCNSEVNPWCSFLGIFELLVQDFLVIPAIADSEDLLRLLKVLLQNDFILFILSRYDNLGLLEFLGFGVLVFHVLDELLHGLVFMHFCRGGNLLLSVLLYAGRQRVRIQEALLL